MSACNWKHVKHVQRKLVLNGSFAVAEFTFTFNMLDRGHNVNQFGGLL